MTLPKFTLEAANGIMFAAIFQPSTWANAPEADPSYTATFAVGADDPRFEHVSSYKHRSFANYEGYVVTARSRKQPTIVFDTRDDEAAWEDLLGLCALSCLDPSILFRERACQALIQPIEYDNVRGTGVQLAIEAIRVLDLTEGFTRQLLTSKLRQF
jgi:hypothetical protein